MKRTQLLSAGILLLALLCIVTGLVFPMLIHSWLQPAADVLSSGVAVALNFVGF